jgi:hypothetical protein
MKRYSIVILLTVLLSSISQLSFAQDFDEENECVRTLSKAEEMYRSGLIEKVEVTLRPCLEGNSLSKEEKLQAYRLIINSKLYDNKEDEAQSAMISFLKTDPEYVPQPGVDSKEFIEMYNEHHTSPLYTIAPVVNVNWGLVQSYGEKGAYNTEGDKKAYTPGLGFGIGARFSRYIYEGLNVHLGLHFQQSAFTYTHDVLEGFTHIDNTDASPAAPTKSATITGTETQQVLRVPLDFSYIFMRQKTIRPYVMAGAELRSLIGTQLSLTKDYLDDNIADVEVPDLNGIDDQRNSMTFSASVGAGVKYKVPRGAFFLEGSYLFGLSDQVKSDVVETNNDQRLWTFHEYDNDFALNHMNVQIGFEYFLYKARAKKSKKNKEDKMFKEAKSSKKKSKKSKSKDSDSGSGEGGTKRQVIE